jgi:hypothetical protein
MAVLREVAPGPTPRDPWFRRHIGFAASVAGVLYVAVFILQFLIGTPVDADSALYALPVALLASAAGLRAGILAGFIGVGLTLLGAVTQQVALSPAGWASRVLPLLILGILLGHATDRQRQAEVERRRLEIAALLHREAIEVNDSLVQGMAAAKWSLDAGQIEAGGQILSQTIVLGDRMVSGLIRRAGMGERTEAVHPAVGVSGQQHSDDGPTGGLPDRGTFGGDAPRARHGHAPLIDFLLRR